MRISAVLSLVLLLLTGCATSSDTESVALRLRPGDDLRAALDAYVRTRRLQSAWIATCAGSLRVAKIRFADAREAVTVAGPLEIVSLSGTLSPDGPHLHIAVSDGEGRTTGGHLAEGSIVYTTAEVVIGTSRNLTFRRRPDAETTFSELQVEEHVRQ